MTDLNLDGLPALKAILSEAQGGDSHSASMFGEIRRLVERQEAAVARELMDRFDDSLPAWAKPVMRAVHAVVNWYKYPGCPEAFTDLEDEWDALTEAQLKEIGEDDG